MEVFTTLGNSDPESRISVNDFQASGRRGWLVMQWPSRESEKWHLKKNLSFHFMGCHVAQLVSQHQQTTNILWYNKASKRESLMPWRCSAGVAERVVVRATERLGYEIFSYFGLMLTGFTWFLFLERLPEDFANCITASFSFIPNWGAPGDPALTAEGRHNLREVFF